MKTVASRFEISGPILRRGDPLPSPPWGGNRRNFRVDPQIANRDPTTQDGGLPFSGGASIATGDTSKAQPRACSSVPHHFDVPRS